MKLTNNFSLGNMHQQIMLHHSATIEFNFRTSFTGCLQGKKTQKNESPAVFRQVRGQPATRFFICRRRSPPLLCKFDNTYSAMTFFARTQKGVW